MLFATIALQSQQKEKRKLREGNHLRNESFRQQLILSSRWVLQLLTVLFTNNQNVELNHLLSYRSD